MLEDFHSLGRLATIALIDLARISAGDPVLDAGTGIGGTARLIAAERGARVTAVDLTPEYCEVAQWLNDAVGLGDTIDIHTADVSALPFDAGSFDVVVSQHVQINIADKRALYAEARRVLAPDGRLALWNVTAGAAGPLHLPVPWATSPDQSHLIPPNGSPTPASPRRTGTTSQNRRRTRCGRSSPGMRVTPWPSHHPSPGEIDSIPLGAPSTTAGAAWSEHDQCVRGPARACSRDVCHGGPGAGEARAGPT